MINQIKKMRQMKTSTEVLNCKRVLEEIQSTELFKIELGLKNDSDSYEKLIRIALKIAVKKASTVEEIEACATAIENALIDSPYVDEWAEQVRIKAYGCEWYLKRQLKPVQSEEFINFLKQFDIPNPFILTKEDIENEL